ncbi:MAG: 3-hydroxyacyl-ACP dehydratase [Bacteroidia bacterium]
MLKNDFYTVKERTAGTDNQFSLVIRLNPEHAIYKGHFPEMPVVPGVCQVQIIKELLEDRLGKNLQMVSGDNIKFTGMIIPTQNATVNIEMSYAEKENNVIGAEAKLFFENIVFTKFKGTFKLQ